MLDLADGFITPNVTFSRAFHVVTWKLDTADRKPIWKKRSPHVLWWTSSCYLVKCKPNVEKLPVSPKAWNIWLVHRFFTATTGLQEASSDVRLQVTQPVFDLSRLTSSRLCEKALLFFSSIFKIKFRLIWARSTELCTLSAHVLTVTGCFDVRFVPMTTLKLMLTVKKTWGRYFILYKLTIVPCLLFPSFVVSSVRSPAINGDGTIPVLLWFCWFLQGGGCDTNRCVFLLFSWSVLDRKIYI